MAHLTAEESRSWREQMAVKGSELLNVGTGNRFYLLTPDSMLSLYYRGLLMRSLGERGWLIDESISLSSSSSCPISSHTCLTRKV